MANEKTATAYKPGSYELIKMELVPADGDPLDLKLIFTDFQITEGIADKTMRGYITFLDSADITNKIEFTGLEKIELEWKSTVKDDPEISFSMQVYKSQIQIADDGTKKLVMLQLVSPEHFISPVKSVSKAYVNSTPSEDVEAIFGETFGSLGKPIEVHPTDNSHTKIIPNLSVLEALEHFCKISYAGQFNTSLFKFYETRDGFYFHNIEKLINTNRGEATKFKYISNVNECPQDEAAQTTVSQIQFNNTKDMMKMLKSGLLANEVKEISLLDKSVALYPFSIKDKFPDIEHLDDHSASMHVDKFYDEYINEDNVMPRTYSIFRNNDFNEGDPMQDTAYISPRLTYLLSLSQMSATMGVHGNTKLKVGDCIDLDMPAATPFEGRDQEPFVSGVWCITAIKHVVDDSTYAMELTLMKDSYRDNAPEGNAHERLTVARNSDSQTEEV